MLAARLRVLGLRVHAVGVLPDGALERDALGRPDRVRRARDDRARQPAIRRERERRAPRGHGFARVAADDQPFARLTFELHDVQHVLVRVGRGRGEIRGFGFDRQELRGQRRVAAVRANRRIGAPDGERRNGAERRRRGNHRDVRQMVEAVEKRERVLDALGDAAEAKSRLRSVRKRRARIDHPHGGEF